MAPFLRRRRDRPARRTRSPASASASPSAAASPRSDCASSRCPCARSGRPPADPASNRRTATPSCCGAVSAAGDDLTHLLAAIGRRPSTARLILQPTDPSLFKAMQPEIDRRPAQMQLHGDLFDRSSLERRLHDLRALHAARWRRSRARQPLDRCRSSSLTARSCNRRPMRRLLPEDPHLITELPDAPPRGGSKTLDR